MMVLVGCEESQVVCQAFRRLGQEAYSCDLVPTRGNPAFHWQMDVVEAIPLYDWDLIILHPDCTAMCLTGNRYYGVGKPRYPERLAAVKWTLGLWALAKDHSPRVALENPRSAIFKYLKAQYIHPWQFGHRVNVRKPV